MLRSLTRTTSIPLSTQSPVLSAANKQGEVQAEIHNRGKTLDFMPKIREICREAGNLAGNLGNLRLRSALPLGYGLFPIVQQNGTGNPQEISFPFWNTTP